MIIEALSIAAALPVGYRLLYGPSKKVEKEEKVMFGLLGGGKGKPPALTSSPHGLWDYKHSITSNAIAQGRRVEMDLKGFEQNGNPFLLSTRFN